MRKMVPLGMFVVIAIVCQTFTVLGALSLDLAGYDWASVLAFGAGYLVMFIVAWKITMLVMDRVLAWQD